jgi:hypothetical protein
MKVKFTKLKIIRDDQCEICERTFQAPSKSLGRVYGTDMCFDCSRKKWIWEEDEVEDESWL